MKKNPLIFSVNEDLWSVILSQNEEKVKGIVKIFAQEAVEYANCHLIKMVSEDG